MTPIVHGLEETYGQEFDFVWVDIDTGDGKALAKENGFIGQPTFIFFDATGEQVRRLQGPVAVETFELEIERLIGE